MHGFTSWLLVLVSIGALTGTFFAIRSGVDVYQKNKAIAQEIAELQEEADRLSSENTLLERKIAYFRTDAFTELEAKEKLNLKRPGERVVMVKGRSAEEGAVEVRSLASERKTSISGGGDSMYRKWYEIFFSYSR